MFRQLVYNPCVISNGLTVISHILYLFSTHNMAVWFSDLASGWTYFTAGKVWSLLGNKEGTNKAWSPTTSLIEVAIQRNFTFLPRVKLNTFRFTPGWSRFNQRLRTHVVCLPASGASRPSVQHHEGDQPAARQTAGNALCPAGPELVRIQSVPQWHA